MKTQIPLGIKLILIGKRPWVMSTYTGEIIEPWKLSRVYGMIRDHRRWRICGELPF